MKALVLEPHDDDLVIGMGGTAVKLLDRGWELKSVLMTDGRHGSQVIPPEKLVELRKKEKERETEFLGIECERLEYRDGKMADVLEKSPENAVNQVKQIIEGYSPDIVFIPAKNEAHPDHRATYITGRKAVEEASEDPREAFYLVWDVPFLDSQNDFIESVVEIDVGPEYDRKLEGIRIHESQEREGDYSEMIDNYNRYLALLYSTYGRHENERSELLGLNSAEAKNLLEKHIPLQDVTEMSHGRSTEDISIKSVKSRK